MIKKLLAIARSRTATNQNKSDIAKAEHILTAFSTSSEDYLKIWPEDKQYFFYEDSFLAYNVSHGVAMILDGAAGNRKYFNRLRALFIKKCHQDEIHVAVLHASRQEKDAWKKLGLRAIYIGGEARIGVDHFCTDSIHNKHFRYVHNKAATDNLTVKEFTGSIDTKLLKNISDDWLSHGRREYSFMMGYFDVEYLQRSRVFVAYKNNIPIAYASVLPSYDPRHRSVDHMRFMKGTSPVTMHFLLAEILKALQQEDVQTFNLGLAPLSHFEDNTGHVTRHVFSVIRKYGKNFYSFDGLEQFKGKFEPEWEPTYLVHTTNFREFGLIGAAIGDLTSYRPLQK